MQPRFTSMGDMPGDAKLNAEVAKARSGDRNALAALLEHHRPELERSARRQLGPGNVPREAPNVLDAIFDLLMQDFGDFRGENHAEFADWLSARLHEHTSSIRGQSGSGISPAEETHNEQAATANKSGETNAVAVESGLLASRAAVPSEQAGRVLPLIRLLPQPQQTVIRLRYLDGWRLSEIAEVEKESPSAIVGRLRLAVQTLKVISSRSPPEVKTWAPGSRETELAIDQLLADYLIAIDEGRGMASDKFVARNPVHAAALHDFFAAEAEWLRILDAAAPTLAPDDSRAAELPPPPRLAEAPQAFGEYEILDTIARGGMGVVYRAMQKKLRRIVALKMILAGQFAKESDILRFQAEAESVARLRHPNIVPIHEVGEHQGHHFYSMDFIEGTSLADEIRRGPLPPTRAAELGVQIARAIDYAHRQGIVHRDLKPANILLDKAGQPHITDFGLAKRNDSDQQLTATGAVVGTPNYMPPEQASGQHDQVGPRSDIYSLGAVLYDMLTGRPPYQAATTNDVLNQVLLHDPLPARALNPHVPTDLDTIIGKCLRKDPAQRYASAQELADDLTRYLQGDLIVARPVSPIERGIEWCRRNPALAMTGAVALLSCLIALAAIIVGYRQSVDALAQSQASAAQADRSFREAKDAVDRFFVRVSQDDLLLRPGLEPLRRELLREADRYYRRLLEQRGSDPLLRTELIQTQLRVGELTEELESPRAAADWYDKARIAALALSAEAPDDSSRWALVGDALNALAIARHKSGDLVAARPIYEEALRVRMKVAEALPAEIEPQRKWANARMNLGLLEKDEGRPERAIEQLTAAQTMRVGLLEGHDDVAVRRDLAMGYYNLANLALAGNDRALAQANLTDALPLFDRLVCDEPARRDYRYKRALCRRLLADLTSTSDRDAALELYAQARGEFDALLVDHPDILDYAEGLATVWMNLGQLRKVRGEPQAARDAFERAAELLEPLSEEAPTLRFHWAKTLAALGELKLAAQEPAAGRADLEHARQALEALMAQDPRDEYRAEQTRVNALLGG